MNIKPEEIDTITTIGHIGKKEVKMIRTKGGLYLGVQSGGNGKVLSVASHPAIIKHKVETGNKGFTPIIEKSEGENEEIMQLSKTWDVDSTTVEAFMIKSESKTTYLWTTFDISAVEVEIVAEQPVVIIKNEKFYQENKEEIDNIIKETIKIK